MRSNRHPAPLTKAPKSASKAGSMDNIFRITQDANHSAQNIVDHLLVTAKLV